MVHVLQDCMSGMLEAHCEQLTRDQSMDQAAVGSYARLLCRARRRPLLVRFWLQLAAGFGLQECQAIWDCAVDDFGAWRCGDVEHAPGEEGWCLEVEQISMQVGWHRHWARACTLGGGLVPGCGKERCAGGGWWQALGPAPRQPGCKSRFHTPGLSGRLPVAPQACIDWPVQPLQPGRCNPCAGCLLPVRHPLQSGCSLAVVQPQPSVKV